MKLYKITGKVRSSPSGLQGEKMRATLVFCFGGKIYYGSM